LAHAPEPAIFNDVWFTSPSRSRQVEKCYKDKTKTPPSKGVMPMKAKVCKGKAALRQLIVSGLVFVLFCLLSWGASAHDLGDPKVEERPEVRSGFKIANGLPNAQ
jgi:hypothetical protein